MRVNIFMTGGHWTKKEYLGKGDNQSSYVEPVAILV
jgi:hypothetical protein